MIGDSGTGKTSLLLRFAEGSFREDYSITIGLDFKIKTLKVDEKHVKL
jgi:GTPase SAR1 family protein